MKEHSFFLQVGFAPRDTAYIERANMLRMELDKLLLDVVNLSNGVVSPDVIQSGEIVTAYTVKAEDVSSFYTGVMIPSSISKKEMQLMGGPKQGIYIPDSASLAKSAKDASLGIYMPCFCVIPIPICEPSPVFPTFSSPSRAPKKRSVATN